MPGTKAGGYKARETNYVKYGDDFYNKIGSLGGRVKTSKPKGFAANPELAVKAGAKGGRKSRRTGVTTDQGKKKEYYYNGDRIFKATKDIKEEIHIEPTQKKSLIKRMFGGE